MSLGFEVSNAGPRFSLSLSVDQDVEFSAIALATRLPAYLHNGKGLTVTLRKSLIKCFHKSCLGRGVSSPGNLSPSCSLRAQ